jgi:hypothetical protein
MKLARICVWVAVPVAAVTLFAGGAEPAPQKGGRVMLVKDERPDDSDVYRGGWVKSPAGLTAVDSGTRREPALSPEDEATVRGACYGRGLPPTAIPMSGKYAWSEVALVPGALEGVYKKHPREVLALLDAIAEGGSPRDSAAAIVYAHVLTDDPTRGALIVSIFDARKYDDRQPGFSSPRQFLLSELRKHLKADKRG